MLSLFYRVITIFLKLGSEKAIGYIFIFLDIFYIKNKKYLYMKAYSYFYLNRFSEAEEIYKSIYKMAPSEEKKESNWWLAKTFFSAKKYEDAIESLTIAVKDYPKTSSVKSRLGLIFLEKQQFDIAEQWFIDALVDFPGDPDALEGIVEIYSENNRDSEIEDFLEKQIEKSSSYASSYSILANYWYYKKNNICKALPYYKSALETAQNKTLWKNSNYLGEFVSTENYFDNLLGDYSSALLYCNKGSQAKEMMRKNLRRNQFQQWQGMFFSICREFQKSLDICNKLYRFDSKNFFIVRNMAYAYLGIGENTKAKNLFSIAFSLPQVKVKATLLDKVAWGVLLEKHGEESGKELLEELRNLDEEEFWICNASVNMRMKEWKMAIAAAQKAKKINPEWYGTLGMLAESYIETGEYEKTISICEKVLDEFEYMNNFRFLLGKAYYRSGLKEAAKKELGYFSKNDCLIKYMYDEAILILDKLENESV